MTNNLIGKRYGQALFYLISEKNKVDEAYADVLSLRKLLSENESILKILNSYFTEIEKKKELIKEISNCLNLKEIWLSFFNILIENKRIIYLESILEFILDFIYKNNKEIYVKLYLAREQDESTINLISEKLTDILKLKPIIDIKLDPSIIGGFKAETESIIIDGSISHNLLKFSKIQKIV